MANQQEIEFHYDKDNDFFELFLDKNYRMYSCGIWEDAHTLEEAQISKLRRMSQFSHIQPGATVLDIGCGWGGLLEYALNIRYAAKVVGLTLSSMQFDYIKKHFFDDHLSVHLKSWQAFNTFEKFDSIVSIGAMEHFVSLEERKRNNHIPVYRKFFQKCADLSNETAYLGLQTIVILKNPDTIQSMKDTHYLLKYVFPGSVLPEISAIQVAMQGIYEPVELKTQELDYARTLAAWQKRLNHHKIHIIQYYGESLWHHYNHYFDAARRSFENGYVSLLQVSLKKITNKG